MESLISGIRLGIISSGNIARKHLEVVADIGWMNGVGITSRSRSKAEILANEFAIKDCVDIGQWAEYQKTIDKF